MGKFTAFIMILFSAGFSQVYDIGNQVTLEDQMTEFEVCYGDYPSGNLKLADFNGELNGGNYAITFIALQNGT